MRSVPAVVLAALLATAAQAQAGRLAADRLAVAEAAPAAPVAPASFAFQGVLHDGGAPVSDGAHAVTVRLFDGASGGTAVYAEDHSVTTAGGVFAVSVGAGTPVSGAFLDVNFSEAVWVEVAWAGTTLSPRTAVEPVPVAWTLRAAAEVRGAVAGPMFEAVNTAAGGFNYGVRGQSSANSGAGIFGNATATTGENSGVLGVNKSTSGRGVYGFASASSGTTFGVYGASASTSGQGVRGQARASSGLTYGVYGEVASPDGYAGFFEGGRGLRVRPAALAVAADVALGGEDVLVEAADAIAGLYSTDGGTWGSGLVLGEVTNIGLLGSKWAVVRRTGAAGGLYFTFGTSADYGANDAQMRIDTDGSVHADGSFTGGGADLAEYFPLAPAASVAPGDLVGLKGGEVSLAASGAEQVMVASTDPAFVGNPDAEAGGALVALVGQAEVRITGTASVGDLLVASGRDDGTARAVDPAAYDPGADGPVAGRVLSVPEAGRVVALVGVDEGAALRAVVAALRRDREADRAEIDALRSQMRALARRLDALTASGPAAAAR